MTSKVSLSAAAKVGHATLEDRFREEVQALAGMPGMRVDAQAGKRPNRSLTAQEKWDAIQRVKAGESKASVARELLVPESTLRGWCKAEEKIRRQMENANRQSSRSPDSCDAYSPGTSSGDGNGLPSGSGNSSDEEAVSGPPSGVPLLKRRRLDGSSIGSAGSLQQNGSDSVVVEPSAAHASSFSQQQYSLEYLSSFLALTEEQRNYVLHQMQLTNATATINLYKALMTKLSTANLLGSSLGTTGSSPTVGLVENGLQYVRSLGNGSSSSYVNGTKSSSQSGSSSGRRSSQVVAPTSFMDTLARSSSRQSVSPAAEAPATLSLAPQRLDTYNSIAGVTNLSTSGSAGSGGSSSAKTSTPLAGSRKRSSSPRASSRGFVWDQHTRQAWQQSNPQSLGVEVAANGTVDTGNFWEFYKRNGMPVLGASAALQQQQQSLHRRSPSATATVTSVTVSPAAATTSSSSSAAASSSSASTAGNAASADPAPANLCTRSPSRIKAVLDSYLAANSEPENTEELSKESASNGTADKVVGEQKSTGESSTPAATDANASEAGSEENSTTTSAAAGATTAATTSATTSEDGEKAASNGSSNGSSSNSNDGLELGERFLSWVLSNTHTELTHLDVLQLKAMVAKMKKNRNPEKSPSLKRSRK